MLKEIFAKYEKRVGRPIILAFGIYIEEYKAFLFWLIFFSHISLLLLSFDISIKEKKEETLNKDAKEFIPTKNRKLKLNENAKEYIPKEKRENKDCECCHGFVYKCAGESCKNLGQCYCKMKDEVEGNDDETDNNK